MAMDDLYQALNMFKSGVQDLQQGRAIDQANQTVQQIKASEMNDQQQRAALQNVSNGLVAHMAQLGTPATTIQMLQGAFGPKQYANSNQMAADAVLKGDGDLMDQAKQLQSFEQDPEFKKELITAKYQAKANAPFASLAFQKYQNEQQEFNLKQLKTYGEGLDASKASSRTGFGQWAATDNRGDRLSAVLGTPDSWKNMTPQQLQLVTEGLGAMTKNSALTKEESQMLMPTLAKVQAANAAAWATSKPQAVDLSGFAGLYNGLVNREDQTAKEKMLDIVMNKVNANAALGMKQGAGDQWKLTTANGLKQLGINVNPSTIQIDPKSGVVIPEIQGRLDAADQAPKAVNQAFADLKAGKPGAQSFFNSYGITASMSKSDAIKQVQRAIKSGIFEQ